jgi:1-aminocyclopropane-1-carboxylate deaminase/D-cysteine desulfhydrase-like pyridoxal-dependent ACC family enzyme
VVGLDCDVLYPGAEPGAPSPNVELARAAGARVVFDAAGSRDLLDEAVVEHAKGLRARGRRPYAVPRGGATATGVFGYVHAARELTEQCGSYELAPRTVVVPTGSGGTQAGLVAGQVGCGRPWLLVGASVSRPAPSMADQVLRLSRAGAAALGLDEPTAADVEVRDCRGAGFGVASAEDRVSSHLALVSEGLLLDDYYGAKAMTLLRTLLAGGSATPAVFWHTGGLAAVLTALTGAAS